jgi:uncharacterized membrane protein YccC
MIIAIIFTGLIVVYGIIALVKIPLTTAVIVALSWIIIGMIVTGCFYELIILPLGGSFTFGISQTFFPNSFPTSASL